MKAEISQRALIEIKEAWDWYESKQKGLGDRFISELENKINYIEKNPVRHPIKKDIFRQVLLKTFPYLIVYFLFEKRIVISSVFHASRNPKKKFK